MSGSAQAQTTVLSTARKWLLWLLCITLAICTGTAVWQYLLPPDAWSPAEVAQIQSLSLQMLPPTGEDPTNRVAADPRAQQLGHALFFDPRLSANGAVSCATCHQPERHFTDGLALSVAIGQTKRNAPSVVGTAYSPWLYWDGRKDSQWSQALAPLEDPAEHGGSRQQYVGLIMQDEDYRRTYTDLFGELPVENAALSSQQVDTVFANLGKAIAAYQRLLVPGVSRFDLYAQTLTEPNNNRSGDHQTDQAQLSVTEQRGLDLFINQANCTQCHNGPLLTNNSFHNTGLLSVPGRIPDKGRIGAFQQLFDDPFNCLGPHNDQRINIQPLPQSQVQSAAQPDCPELKYAKNDKELVGAFRTPSLRNLNNTEPYGHAGQLPDLAAVLRHYNLAPDAMIGHNEAKPLDLWPWQLAQLEAFLLTLQAPVNAAPRWLEPPAPGYLTK